ALDVDASARLAHVAARPMRCFNSRILYHVSKVWLLRNLHDAWHASSRARHVTPAATAEKPTTGVNDLAVPLGIVAIVMMMVLPLPRVLVDLMLAVSLAISIGVFLIGLFMEQPLEFSSFPAVILVATLLRLSLNVATTRLILLHGKEG